MSLQGIIPPMSFELVKASIASLIATERNNQVSLLQADGKTAEEIDNGYYFNVFKDKFDSPDVSQLPCVNIYNSRGAFDESKDYTDSKWHVYSLAVDVFSTSTAEPGQAADQLCAARLDYLWSQIFHILGSEENWHKGLKSVVRASRFTNWEQKLVKVGNDDTAESTLAIQSTLELQFNESTETLTGVPLEELVASLEIDDQFISPFVTVQTT